jgi:hypothetical protein
MKKRILDKNRIRSIQGSFAFIPHRFLTDGYLKRLGSSELLLYLFLILVSDACGLSFYADRSLCRLLQCSVKSLKADRQVLIDRGLIAFEPPLYQVLELPESEQGQIETGQGPPAIASFEGLRRFIGE